MSGAGIYTAERFCAEKECTFVDRLSKLAQRIILESVQQFLEILKSVNYNI
jgi:hypothetical protein